jgi:DNA-binding CsgD family transcriptional regulator
MVRASAAGGHLRVRGWVPASAPAAGALVAEWELRTTKRDSVMVNVVLVTDLPLLGLVCRAGRTRLTPTGASLVAAVHPDGKTRVLATLDADPARPIRVDIHLVTPGVAAFALTLECAERRQAATTRLAAAITAAVGRLDTLTHRDRALLAYAAAGLDEGEIAAAFGVAPATVTKRIRGIATKLDGRRGVDLGTLSIAHGGDAGAGSYRGNTPLVAPRGTPVISTLYFS